MTTSPPPRRNRIDLADYLKDPESHGMHSPARHFGLRFAVIEDDKDPEKMGRYKVRVTSTHTDDIPLSKLQWAIVMLRTGGNPDTGQNYGEMRKFKVGSAVIVEFINGQSDFPVIVGAWQPRKAIPSAFTSNAAGQLTKEGEITADGFSNIITNQTGPDVKQQEIRTPDGFLIRLVDKPAADAGVYIITPDGRAIRLKDGSDKLEIVTTKGTILLDDSTSELTVTWQGKVKINATTDVEVTSGTNIKMTAPKIVLAGQIMVGQDGLTALNGIVTRIHKCAFTGGPHPDASTSVMASPT